jgi:N-acetylglucosaminyl-diphospho-decaprenol L-rhamnosyltransferase
VIREPEGRRVSLVIIVVSYNVRDLLRKCLTETLACLARSSELDATVIVVDNASADGSASMIAAEFPQVRLVPSSANLGFAGGNNLALKALGFREARPVIPEVAETLAGGHQGFWNRVGLAPDVLPDMIMLLNPDAEPVGESIGLLARFLADHPKAGGAGPELRYPDGRFQQGAFRFPGLMQLWLDLFPPHPRRLLDGRLNGRYPRAWYEAGKPFPVDFVLGAALMARREAIQAIGLLDTGYFMYAEEVDWCWRIQRAGWPFYCVPGAVVVHHGGASAQQFREQSFLNLWRSRLRLYEKFYGRMRRALAILLVQLGMQAEMRRAGLAARRGAISSQEAIQRTDAAQRVLAIIAGQTG